MSPFQTAARTAAPNTTFKPTLTRDDKQNLINTQLGKYAPRHQKTVQQLAAQNPALADLALSFPALLFALAVPRTGFNPQPVIQNVGYGQGLKYLSWQAGLPLWLRKLPPETFTKAIPLLPHSADFSRKIVNHVPRSSKHIALWFTQLCSVLQGCHEELALWVAALNNQQRQRLSKEYRLALLMLWGWHSTQSTLEPEHRKPYHWQKGLSFRQAIMRSDEWMDMVNLWLFIGDDELSNLGMQPAKNGDFEFVPLLRLDDIIAEAKAMQNCITSYGHPLAGTACHLWSVRRNGISVANFSVFATWDCLLPVIRSIKGPNNRNVKLDIIKAIRRWFVTQNMLHITLKRDQHESIVSAHRWREMWRGYWLAKQTIPHWLPLNPTTTILDQRL